MAIPILKPVPPVVEYPESDGKPMGETDEHRDEMADVIGALKDFFRDRADVYVSGNLLIYYEKGNPKLRRSPDVFVVVGVPAGKRRIYKLWEEGVAPKFVIEVSSKGTKNEDLGEKKKIYAEWGVDYYFLYDPLGEYLEPALQGLRLAGKSYRKIPEGPGGVLECRELGLLLRLTNDRLVLIDTRTGKPLLRPSGAPEKMRAAQAERDQAHQEAQEARQEAQEARMEAEEARRTLEAEIARLRARLETSE